MNATVDPNDSMFQRLGGEQPLRKLIDVFVERVVGDTMIGFYFRKTNLPRLKELEYQHAAEFLGAPVQYRGKPLDAAHHAHSIRGGHFDRRLQILKEVLEEASISTDVANAWLGHNRALRAMITNDGPGQCDPTPGT